MIVPTATHYKLGADLEIWFFRSDKTTFKMTVRSEGIEFNCEDIDTLREVLYDISYLYRNLKEEEEKDES